MEKKRIKLWLSITPEEYKMYQEADILDVCFYVDGNEHEMTFKKEDGQQ